MPARYTDMESAVDTARDFVARRRAPSLFQMIVITTLCAVVGVGLLLSIDNRWTASITLVALLALACWYVVVQLQRHQDLLLATEFQNALFASALGLNNKFCVIIRRNGGIVYIDRAFQKMFPDFLRQSQGSIHTLLERGKVSEEDSNRIFSAIERGVYEKVVFDIKGSDGAFSKIIMSIEPILRPSGFILLRGREFVESRASNGEDVPSTLMSKHTITLFSHVMDTMNMGVYMTAPDGGMVYVNPVLEQWLGYGEGEITARNMALQDMVHQGNARPDRIEPGNFEGEVMLQRKTGGVLKSFINQKTIRDESGKVVGCTGLVHHFAEQQAGQARKALW